MNNNRYLYLGNACNLKCNYCYNDLERDSKTFFRDLKELYKEIEFKRLKRDDIALSGGEVFLHPDIDKILLLIKKSNFKDIRITTNGIPLSNMGLIKKLFLYKVNKLEFSINASNSKLDSLITLRNSNNFLKREVAIKNIIAFNKKLDHNIKLSTNSVITKDNYNDIGNIIRYISSLNISEISLSFIYDIKGLSEINKQTLIKYSDVINEINKIDNSLFLNNKIIFCWLPYCLHKFILNKKYIIREKMDYENSMKNINLPDNKNAISKCIKCSVYGKYCNGIDNEYLKKYGDKEFNTIK